MSAVERIAAARADAARERVADALGAALPGAAVTIEGERVVVEGRGLRAAAIGSETLRWIAGAVR